MNIKKLKMAEAQFLAQYPQGFADPGLAPIRKKHNVDKLSAFAQAHLTRAHFKRPERIAETLIKIISRSSMVSMFEKPKFRDFVASLNGHEREHLAFAFEKRLQGFYIAFPVEDLHHVAEGTDPGKDQSFRVGDLFTAAGDSHGFAEILDGIDDAADIAGAVIK